MATAPTEEEIHALPESSDEEDAQEDKPGIAPELQVKQPLKRPLEEVSNNRRSKRWKKDETEDAPSEDSKKEETLKPSQETLPDFLSQSSQSKRRKGYGSSSQRSRQQAPSPNLDTPKKKVKHPSFELLGSSPVAAFAEQAPAFRAPSRSPAPVGRPSFVTPGRSDDGDDDLEPSADSTISSHARRGSTSSLSSVDSLPDYQLDVAVKKRLMTDALDNRLPTTLPQGHFFCSICKKTSFLSGLDLSFLQKPNQRKKTVTISDLRKLTIPKLQSLCRTHRIRDAQITWKQRDYPFITSETWSVLPDRVSKHISYLSSVLRRKKPSYYLTHLDDAIASARGSQKAINTYFNVTALSLIHHGYYGPKGSKIVGQTLLGDKTLEKALGKQNKNDKNMRIAGIGRLVDSVLVPEVLMRLAGEDMGVQDEEARKILEESSYLGVLLCGDDDEIDVPDDDDE